MRVRLKLIKEAIPHFLAKKKQEYMKVVAMQVKKIAKELQVRASRTHRLIRQARKSARETLTVAKRKTLVIRNPRNLAIRRPASPTASNAGVSFQPKCGYKGAPRSPFKSPAKGIALSRNRSIPDRVPRKTPRQRTTIEQRPEWNSGWNNKIHR